MILFHDLKLKDGRTIREHNMELKHNIPIGALVEVKFDAWFGGGACWKVHARLWVVRHDRDCDGTPLYLLSRWDDLSVLRMSPGDYHSGISEEALTVIDVTPEIVRGDGNLEWEDEAGHAS